MTDRAILFFDLDGCLVDSRRAITTCLNRAFAELGLPLHDPVALEALIGPPFLDGLTDLLSREQQNVTVVPEVIARYRVHYRDVAPAATTIIPGIAEVLAVLRRPFQLAVVTSKATVFAHTILDATGLASCFDGVYGTDLTATDETKIVTLRRACAGLQGGRAMIGDRAEDVRAGRAAGLTSVGVTWGTGDRVELMAAAADHVVDRPQELIALLTTVDAVSRPARQPPSPRA